MLEVDCLLCRKTHVLKYGGEEWCIDAILLRKGCIFHSVQNLETTYITILLELLKIVYTDIWYEIRTTISRT